MKQYRLTEQSICDSYPDEEDYFDYSSGPSPCPYPASGQTLCPCLISCPSPCPCQCPCPCPSPCQYEFCFTVTKRDGTTGAPLADAEYTLYQSGEALGYVTSDTTGRLKFNGLFPGIYELKETKAPNGYQLDTASHLVRIARNGSIEIDGIALTDFRLNDTAIPVSVYPFRFIKYDSATGRPLAGASFRLSNGMTVTSDADGIVDFKGLPAGTYTLIEIDVPERYQINTTPQTVVISETGQITVNGTALESVTFSNDRLLTPVPEVNTVYAGARTLTGTGISEAIVSMTAPDFSTYEVTVGSDGTWLIQLPAAVTLTAGDVLHFVQKQEGHFSSNTVSITVQPASQTP